MMATVPPSADHAAPVTVLARSLHRKTITSAISSGSARRPSGTLAAWASSASSRVTPRASAAWSASPPAVRPQLGGDRAGRDGVDEHAVGGEAVGEDARQRQLGGLGHRVGGVRQRRALARRRGHVDDPPAAARGHPRRGRAHEAHRRHHVQLPLRAPVLVGELVERPREARAGVVDEHVDAAHLLGAGGDDALVDLGVGDVGGEVLGADLARRRLGQALGAAGDHQHLRPLGGQPAARSPARSRGSRR